MGKISIFAFLLFSVSLGCGSGSSPGESLGGNGDLPFLSVCDPTNDLCDGGASPVEYCFEFNNRGPLCTHACDTAEDCEAPSPGCNGMGSCKSPGDDDGGGTGGGDGVTESF